MGQQEQPNRDQSTVQKGMPQSGSKSDFGGLKSDEQNKIAKDGADASFSKDQDANADVEAEKDLASKPARTNQ